MDTYLTLRPINFLLKCFALNCVCKKDNNIISSWSLIKNLLILFILVSISAIIWYDFIKAKSIAMLGFTYYDTFIVLHTICFLKYVVDLVCVRKYGTKDCVSYYYAYDKMDHILKNVDYNKMKLICLKITAMSCVLFIVSVIIDYVAWYLTAEEFPIYHSVEYFYSFATLLTILDMTTHVLLIEHRLRTLGDVVEKFNISRIDTSKLCNLSLSVASERTGLVGLKTFTLRAIENGICTQDDILLLTQCYLILIKQTEFINTLFGFRILFTCIVSTINLVNLLNIIIRLLFGTMISSFGKLPILSCTLFILCICSSMYILAHRCEKVCRQRDRIIDILDNLLVYSNFGKETILSFKDLRELISSRPIQFHASHFFQIDYTLLSAMTSFVVTYTIIYMQNLT